MGTLTSLTVPMPEADSFSPGLLGRCEEMVLAKYGIGHAISLDPVGSRWNWTVWAPDGSINVSSARLSESRADAIDYLESFLRRQ